MNTTTPFYLLSLCAFCGCALIGSEVDRGVCGHCRGDFLPPKPKRRRLRWWTVGNPR